MQQLPPVAADKEEMFSTQKKLENSKSDDEFIEKTKEKVMTKKILKRKEKRWLLVAKNKELKKSKKVKQD